MIQSTSYNTAIPFAEQLAEKGVKVVALPSTPLSELVRLSAPSLFPTQMVENGDLISIGTAMQGATEGTLEAPTQHSLEIDALVKQLSTLVTGHVSYARNVVRPHVTGLAEAIQNYLDNNRPKEAGEEFSIETLRVPAVLKDESFLDTLSYYKDKSVLTPDLSFSLGAKTTEELTQMVMIGSDRVDRLIVEWLSHTPANFLLTIWDSFFTKSSSVGYLTYPALQQMNAYERSSYLLAYLLLARKVTDDVQTETVPLAAYRRIALQYTDYAGAALVEALRRIELSLKGKQLVVSVDQARKIAKVNGELYGPWLDAGGSPEVILGMVVAGNAPTAQDLIDSRAQEYLRSWNSYVTFYRTKEANMALRYKKDFIIRAFGESLKSVDPIEQEYMAKNPEHLANVVRRAAECVESLKESELADVYNVALCLVGGVRFHYTSAHQILSDIHEAGKINPNVDVREAALLAVINYVADYLAAQMTTTAA